MAYCTLCRKTFRTDQALKQHTEDSPAHKSVSCELCNKTFPSPEALIQHSRDSPAHQLQPPRSQSEGNTAPTRCTICKRDFSNPESLTQHLQTSSKHARSPAAPSLSPSPPSHPCPHCTRTFSSTESLAQHTLSTPFHAPTHRCPRCPRTFRSATALAQHIRDSAAPAHSREPPRNTPLDTFFLLYASTTAFAYDRTASPSASFAALSKCMRWRGDDADRSEAWSAYMAALRRELDVWFGGEDDVGNWQALCRAVGITPAPETAGECEGALRGRHVNLVDLLAWARSGEKEGEVGAEGPRGEVEVFGSVEALRAYCQRTGKWFPLDEVARAGQNGDGNVVIRHLLRRFWGGRKGGRKDSAVGLSRE
ncbi:hypothetical protein B0J12DRAFT_217627 [Macrophomina phaseolina]|uniref:C2H2-type domain-containing protein n=1 Tax=Macrophomina phaseolina TaxID=35725 RepID=A0ABQ8G429_9PEZI|nr:hypothetical protein B0J12DRAFT_217627 [Macrophomina phaseolina]